MKIELITKLKWQVTKILAELHESKEPVLITEHAQPPAYFVDVKDFELMWDRIYLLEGVPRGERTIQEGQTLTAEKGNG